MVDPKHLAGAAELGQVLGVQANTINQWRSRYPDFPPPLATLNAGAIWDVRAVIAWADATQRPVRHRDYVAPGASTTAPEV
jgi:hypothetical protein